MTVRVGINGFGRIGRNFFRANLAQGAFAMSGGYLCVLLSLSAGLPIWVAIPVTIGHRVFFNHPSASSEKWKLRGSGAGGS